MNDFQDSVNWDYAVTRLRTACMGQPIELQLLWLFEILTILLFKANVGTRYVIRMDEAYRLTHRNMASVAGSLGLSKLTVGRLASYRDTFVHFGYLEATPLLEKFFERTSSEEIDLLQQVTGVTLNMRNSLA